jgi:glycosyltransferase involved in cell wall biosynthesis
MRIVLVSANAGTSMGGEAIKAYQYFKYLLDQGLDVLLFTHERCRMELLETCKLPRDRIHFVADSLLQNLLWRSRVFARHVDTVFHLEVARACKGFDPAQTLIHYLCPISPTVRRHPPKGYEYVVGPLSGNLFFPPAFKDRAGRGEVVEEFVYRPAMNMSGVLSGDLRRAARVLNSGYQRTRDALDWAGCKPDRILDVVDSGIDDALQAAPRIEHEGVNRNFIYWGRLIDLKGVDLAIRALLLCEDSTTLTVYGTGPALDGLKHLAQSLGLEHRVRFGGWISHEELVTEMRRYRGFVFPTLCESNGISMQEAMMQGLPTVALRWGGPMGIANENEAVFVDPSSEQSVIDGLAGAMMRLGSEPKYAESISAAARKRAQAQFGWGTVARSWMAAYEGVL